MRLNIQKKWIIMTSVNMTYLLVQPKQNYNLKILNFYQCTVSKT